MRHHAHRLSLLAVGIGLLAGCGTVGQVEGLGGGRDGGQADFDGGSALPGADAGSTPDAGTAHDAGAAAEPRPLRDDGLPSELDGESRARVSVDEAALDAALRNAGALPAGSWVHAVRLTPGVSGPTRELFSAGGGAFDAGFWPASTIKLLAAVGALERIAGDGFTGRARVDWDSGFGDGVEAIYRRSIVDSSNRDYDRTLRLAGYDWTNTVFLSPERGFRTTVITSSYSNIDVRNVGGLTLTEGDRSGRIEARSGTGSYGRNDTNLYELTLGLERVMLHDELPDDERFELAPHDVEALQDALCDSTTKYFRAGVEAVLGTGARICNKYGVVSSSECLDHALVETPDTGERYLLAAAVPYGSCASRLSAIAEVTLGVLRSAADGVPIARDGGVSIPVQVEPLEGAVRLRMEAEGADAVELWLDGEPLATRPREGRFVVRIDGLTPGSHELVLRAWAGGTLIGHRNARVETP